MSGLKKPEIRLEDAKSIKCDACNGEVFIQGVLLKSVSKFLTGTDQDGLIPIPTFACIICGHVNDSFQPKSLT